MVRILWLGLLHQKIIMKFKFLIDLIKMESYRRLDIALTKKSSENFIFSEDLTNEGVKMFHVTTLKMIKNKISKQGEKSYFYGLLTYPCKFFIHIDLDDEEININRAIKEIKKIMSVKVKIAKKGNLFYRLVFPSIIVNNSEEAEKKCKYLIEKMKSDVKDYIDTSTYFENTQYLLLGCSKKKERICLESEKGSFSDFFLSSN